METRTHRRRAARAFRRILAALIGSSLLAPVAVAQGGCPDFGSTPVAASITASPLPMGCAGAPTWPHWHLFTPGHRAPGPHAGFTPGHAHALPRLLVRYRCTGLLLVPVVPDGVRVMGYVIDQPEFACAVRS
ncbi:MAG: hypothetical protein JNL08_11440 [Planctomycetes bacterium]|nr:hypothetical protein [Planctomycetota bacterium]